jgi:hypothetical protein
VRFWFIVRKPLTVLATLCNLAFAAYVSLHGISHNTLNHTFAVLAFSTLAILDRLHIPRGDAHVAAVDILLQHTMLLNASFYERHLALVRPMWNEVFCCDLQVYHVWFWKFFSRAVLNARRSLLVVTNHWTWRGYENRLIEVC